MFLTGRQVLSRILSAAGAALAVNSYSREAKRIVPRTSMTGRMRTGRDGDVLIYHKPNGAQECARRMRQIERGQLTASNGLVSERSAHVKVNSHGRIHTFCRPCQARLSTPDGPGECCFPDCADVRANGCAA